MIGIYKITNKLDGKIYVGQSSNIERRKREHFEWNKNSHQYIDIIIRELGADNFSFEIIEECKKEELTQKEKYYIELFDSFYNGYNKTKGGQEIYHGNPKLNKQDVINIRTAYNNKEPRKEVYILYKDKISFSGFCHVWDGSRWKEIMPEVYSEENKKFHREKSYYGKGEKNSNSKLTDEEVIRIRQRYVNETALEIWQDYRELYTLGSFKQILGGTKYSHLPIYKKSKGVWINV